VYVVNTKSADVSRFLVDPVMGTLTLKGQFVTKATGGTAIAVSPSDQYVFVGGFGVPNTTGALFGFTLNQESGSLAADPNSPYGASLFPQGMAVDPTSQFLFATASQQHEVSAYAIGTPATTLLTQVASSPVSTGSTPYGVAVSPTGTAAGGVIFVSNNDRVSVFFYDNLGNLTEAKNSPWPSGLQPEGLAVDPTGSYLYVANYLDGTVSSFGIGPKGQLTPIATGNNAFSTGNLTGVPNPGPIDVKVDPAGPYIYVVNSLDGSVSLFTASAGTLTLVATYPTGSGATPAAAAIY
jgi:6-phosphogluconolactonase (cycloisomerase 2 family)